MDLKVRTWAEISLENIQHNMLEMKKKINNGKFLGVVKADAYGHGATKVARALQDVGCDYLAVACTDEAVDLRLSGVKIPILILGHTEPSDTDRLLDYNITPTVNGYWTAKKMNDIAHEKNMVLTVHIKVDSGMGRLGFTCHDGEIPDEDILKILELKNLNVEGIFTHFALSDELDQPSKQYTKAQFENFKELYTRIEEKSGKKFAIKHCTNSGAMVSYPETYLDMVRPGILLYGVYDGDDLGGLDLRPAMQLKTKIYQTKYFKKGYSISYGCTYTTARDSRIAVIPIGYADGLHRALSNKMEVLVCGKRAKQVGRICMDMCMIDVTDIPEAKVGDTVTIFGTDGNETISVAEQAHKEHTISYELLCAVSQRVPRIY